MIKRFYFLLAFFTPLIIKGQEGLVEFNRNELIQSGRKAFFDRNLPELIKITDKVNSLYLLGKDSLLLAKYYHFKALQCKLRYKNDSAFYYYEESKNISKIIKNF